MSIGGRVAKPNAMWRRRSHNGRNAPRFIGVWTSACCSTPEYGFGSRRTHKTETRSRSRCRPVSSSPGTFGDPEWARSFAIAHPVVMRAIGGAIHGHVAIYTAASAVLLIYAVELTRRRLAQCRRNGRFW